MKTFSQEVDEIVAESIEADVEPDLWCSATGMVVMAQKKIREAARQTGHSDGAVRESYEGKWGEVHMGKLLEFILEVTPVDVKVSRDGKDFLFQTCNPYEGGKKHYDFPVWRVETFEGRVYCNYEHLEKLPNPDVWVRAFVGVLGAFKYDVQTYHVLPIYSRPHYWSWGSKGLYGLLDNILQWAQKHPQAALNSLEMGVDKKPILWDIILEEGPGGDIVSCLEHWRKR